MPLHAGHMHLIATALSQAERLSIMLVSDPTDPIPSDVRLSWLKAEFPLATLLHHSTPLPRDESGFGHWDTWSASIRSHIPADIDVVFSSETYGPRLAEDLQICHEMVDRERTQVPISATTIRNEPEKHAALLPERVRAYYGFGTILGA